MKIKKNPTTQDLNACPEQYILLSVNTIYMLFLVI